MPEFKDFKVAIVGGGMCGLACAIGLVKEGIQVELYEAAPKFDEVGAGVGLGPNAIRALEGLGVFEAVMSRADQPSPVQRPFRYLTGHANHVHDYPSYPGDLGLGIYRKVPAFLEALMPLLDPKLVQFNKRCTGITSSSSGSKVLHFVDGTTAEANLIVGADGIRSTTRRVVVGDTAVSPLRFTKTVAYRGLVPTATLKAAGVKTDMSIRPICWIGTDKHIITFPIRGDKIINIVAFVSDRQRVPYEKELPSPWVEEASEGELLSKYADWGSDATIMLKLIKNPSKWSIHALHPPLPSFVRENIVLVGDAAHGMLPHLGAGVGQGFEDVFVLCKLLGHHRNKGSNLKDILSVYDAIRVPRANMVLERSAETGDMYDGYGETRCNMEEFRTRFAGRFEPVWHHDLEAEIAAALHAIEMEIKS